MTTIDKETKNKANREYYARHKSRLQIKARAASSDYYHRNKDKVKAKLLIYKNNNPEKTMLNSIRAKCKRLGIKFDLSEKDIIIPTHCPLLGIEFSKRGGDIDYRPSVDRIQPHLGYTKENIWVISNRANRIKTDASLKELELLTKNLKEKLDYIKEKLNV